MTIKKEKSYGKLASESYGIWFPENPEGYEDTDFYRQFIQDKGEPALELGCGDGRLLVPFACEGLDVSGVDLSPHMLDICRAKAKAKGVSPHLYQQGMQALDLPQKYKTVFIPYGSFMLVSDLNDARAILKGAYQHLQRDGTLIIPLFLPYLHDIHIEAPQENIWRIRREGIRNQDGALFKCWEKAHYDFTQQLEIAEFRLEVFKDGELIESDEENMRLRWYTQEQFREMLTEAGFAQITCRKGYSALPAEEKDSEFTFIAKKLST